MKKVRVDLFFWVFYFAFCYFSDEVIYPKSYLFAEVALFLSHNVLLFYGLYYCLIKFSSKTVVSTILSFIRIASVLSVFFVIRYYVRLKLLPFYFGDAYGAMNFHQWLITGIIWVVNYFFFASAYYYFVSSRNKQLRVNALIQQTLEKEKENLQLENTLLKTQINPHFLYNSLNFLYAKSLPLSTDLSDGIIKLSEIMRYSLQSHEVDGLVLLSDEVEHLRNVIGMARLRFSNKIFIEFRCDGNIEGVKIIPLVLITLVENILKHGVINDSTVPAKIDLILTDDGVLQFSTRNKKRIGPKELSTGIGLNNVIKRLENFYCNGCKVTIEDQNSSFRIDLQLHLSSP